MKQNRNKITIEQIKWCYPLETIKTAFRHLGNRAKLKKEITRLAEINVALLPVNPDIEAYVTAAQQEGREVIFASASNEDLVQRLADHHGIPGHHIGSTEDVNLSGKRKAEALNGRYGKGQYAYAGDQKVDLDVWRSSGEAIVVGHHPNITAKLEEEGIKVVQLAKTWSRRSAAIGLRPHQWVKNALLFLPLLGAHSLEPEAWLRVLFAVAAFSAAASSIYMAQFTNRMLSWHVLFQIRGIGRLWITSSFRIGYLG